MFPYSTLVTKTQHKIQQNPIVLVRATEIQVEEITGRVLASPLPPHRGARTLCLKEARHSLNCDFELKNGSGFCFQGFIAGERFEHTTVSFTH